MVPPPAIWGGWLSFVSLLMIGILTTFINDLASIFGCLVGLKDMVTAITFIALGTSLPGLFASRQAAVQEKYTDNTIDNVAGSNSINVFMGQGVSSVFYLLECEGNFILFYLNVYTLLSAYHKLKFDSLFI